MELSSRSPRKIKATEVALVALALSLAAGAVVACSSGDGTPAASTSTGTTSASTSAAASTGAGGASGTTVTSGVGAVTSSGTASTGAGGNACPGPGYGGKVTHQSVNEVTATVVDLGGAPVAALPVQLCGLNVCTYGTTDASGQVTVAGMAQSFVKPAFKYGDGVTYGKLAIPVTSPMMALGTVTAAPLPPIADGVVMAAGKTATSGGVTLNLASGTQITIDMLDFDTPAKQRFRAVEIPLAKIPGTVDPGLNLEVVFATTPIGTVFCPATELTVPNSAAWAAGAKVDFYLQGVDPLQEWAPYGGWAKVAQGTVSADGKTITTPALPVLGALGLKLAP